MLVMYLNLCVQYSCLLCSRLCLSGYLLLMLGDCTSWIISSPPDLLKIIVLIYFLGRAGSSLQPRLFSSWGERGLLSRGGAQVSLQRLLLLRGMGSRASDLQQFQHTHSAAAAPRRESAGSAVATHGLSCSMAWGGIYPDQGAYPGLRPWQMDPSQLSDQEAPPHPHPHPHPQLMSTGLSECLKTGCLQMWENEDEVALA